MKIIRFKEAQSCEPEKDWKRLSLCDEKDISVEHFVKPPHHTSPFHRHPETQVLMVLKGKLTIINDRNKPFDLDECDSVSIAGNEPHRVVNPLDTPSTGLDIFVPGRSFDYWLKRKQ